MIQFDHHLAGQTITLTSGELVIDKSLDIEGPGADRLTISGNDASRVFDIRGSTTDVEIRGLTIAHGRATDTTAGPSGLVTLGGGLLNTGAHVTLSGVTFEANQAVGHPTGYVQTNLVSNLASENAQITDPDLTNPWGTAQSDTGPLWVSDAVAGVSTAYSVTAAGVHKEPLTVTIPINETGFSGPTGQAYNDTSSFLVNGTPASFIFANLNGTISAWNPSAGTTAQIEATSPDPGGYTGLVLSTDASGHNVLYAAKPKQGRIEVFDGSFQPVNLGPGAFVDPLLPSALNLSPFNVEDVNGDLYVAYAPARHADQNGATEGQGAVAVFDTSGHFLRQLILGSKLAAPWGITLAPSSFGKFGGDLLVANDSYVASEINAFDPVSGAYLGTLTDSSGNTLLKDANGLWDLTFGNGGDGGLPGTLYFATGLNGEADGLFGAIAPVPVIAEGGAVANVSGGTLTLSHDVIADNQALGAAGGQAQGGGIYNTGTLTVDHSTFSGNMAQGGRVLTTSGNTRGGGLDSDLGATTTVSYSTFSDNRAIGGSGDPGIAGKNGSGGGLWNGNGSALTVSHSTFTGNQAHGGDGGDGQAGGDGDGGAIQNNSATLVVVDSCVFTDNLAMGGRGGDGGSGGPGDGGGLINVGIRATAVTVRDSTFRGNRAVGGAGGAGGTGGLGSGGGINNAPMPGVLATLTVTDCTLSDSEAEGGAGGAGANGGDGFGGGLYVVGGTVTVSDCRITGNEADGSAGSTDGQGGGGGLYNAGGTVRVHGTRIKHNHASTSGDDVFGDLDPF
jgi:uncharacterized protein (TIGR03118 family)